MSSRPSTLTVQALIDLLEDEDPDALVVFVSNYGDRSRTMQVHFLKGSVGPIELEKSAYSDSGWAVRDPQDDDGEAGPAYLVIS